MSMQHLLMSELADLEDYWFPHCVSYSQDEQINIQERRTIAQRTAEKELKARMKGYHFTCKPSGKYKADDAEEYIVSVYNSNNKPLAFIGGIVFANNKIDMHELRLAQIDVLDMVEEEV